MTYGRGILSVVAILLASVSFVYAQTDLTGTLFDSSTQNNTNVAVIALPVDLLVDSDSYTPPFYRGRALPAIGTSIQLVALVHPPTIAGVTQSPSDFVYTWHQDDRAVGNVSGQGRSSVTLPAPMLYGSTNIQVDVESQDYTLVGSASITIPATEPVIQLYQDNPLIGITFNHSLSAQTIIPETETTFAAIPFFAAAQSANDPQLEYAWSLNNSAIAASASNPSELTVNASHSNGLATIGLSVKHATNFFMDFEGSWNVSLGSSGSNGFVGTSESTNDPFGGTTQ